MVFIVIFLQLSLGLKFFQNKAITEAALHGKDYRGREKWAGLVEVVGVMEAWPGVCQ